MRKTLLRIFVVTAVISALSMSSVLAHGGRHRWNYIDANGDGICDNYGGCRGGNCYSKYYVDADGDGVCDNYENLRFCGR